VIQAWVAAEDIDKIFNQFYRSQSNSHPEIKGTGLGLSIVKKTVYFAQY
jgi:signal transduction histidine kinase